MPQELQEPEIQSPSPGGASKLVPVGESIKYRHRAQQAENRLQNQEQQLRELQAHHETHKEELASIESQRDEARYQLTVTENRLASERMLSEAGAIDLEAASLLLSKRMDFGEPFDAESLARNTEQLLLDKPFLRKGHGAALPPKTAGARLPGTSATAQLTEAAERAIGSGNRKDIVEYLRLRRQTAKN